VDEVASKLRDSIPNVGIKGGGHDHEASGAVKAVFDHGGGKHVLPPELLERGAAQFWMMRVLE
jgi:hypothetical protein